MPSPTPCYGKGPLFDSRLMADHQQAKALCATCPALTACRANLRAVIASPDHGNPEGTWAGKLHGRPLTPHGAGQMARARKREAGL